MSRRQRLGGKVVGVGGSDLFNRQIAGVGGVPRTVL